jgi:hypothetical protein
MRSLFLPNINRQHTCNKSGGQRENPVAGESGGAPGVPARLDGRSARPSTGYCTNSTASRLGTEYPGWRWDED